jgi:hypothetical protein
MNLRCPPSVTRSLRRIHFMSALISWFHLFRIECRIIVCASDTSSRDRLTNRLTERRPPCTTAPVGEGAIASPAPVSAGYPPLPTGDVSGLSRAVTSGGRLGRQCEHGQGKTLSRASSPGRPTSRTSIPSESNHVEEDTCPGPSGPGSFLNGRGGYRVPWKGTDLRYGAPTNREREGGGGSARRT